VSASALTAQRTSQQKKARERKMQAVETHLKAVLWFMLDFKSFIGLPGRNLQRMSPILERDCVRSRKSLQAINTSRQRGRLDNRRKIRRDEVFCVTGKQ